MSFVVMSSEKYVLQFRAVERRGEKDARLFYAPGRGSGILGAVEMGGDDVVRRAQGFVLGEERAAAVGEQIARFAAGTALSDAVGIGVGQ